MPSLIRPNPGKPSGHNTKQFYQGPARLLCLPVEVQYRIIDSFDNPIDATNFSMANRYTYHLTKYVSSAFHSSSSVAPRVPSTTKSQQSAETAQKRWLDTCFYELSKDLRRALFKDPNQVKPFPLIGSDTKEIGKAWRHMNSAIRSATAKTTNVLSKQGSTICDIMGSLDVAITHSTVLGGNDRPIKAAGRIVDRFILSAVNLFQSPELATFNFGCLSLCYVFELKKKYEIQLSQVRREQVHTVLDQPWNALSEFSYFPAHQCIAKRCSPYLFLASLTDFHHLKLMWGYKTSDDRLKQRLKLALQCAFFDPELDHFSCAWLLTGTLLNILDTLNSDFDPFVLKQIAEKYKQNPIKGTTEYSKKAAFSITMAAITVKSLCKMKIEACYNQFFDVGFNKFNERSTHPQAYRDHFLPIQKTFDYLLLHGKKAPKDIEEMLGNPHAMTLLLTQKEDISGEIMTLTDALLT